MIEECVSVIMPAYNSAKTISYAIDSVFIQDRIKELIIIDDCSSDNTEDTVKAKIADNKYNIIYLKNKKNMGAAFSRNRGISLAKGEYIAFLDADDIWRSDKINKQIELINKTGAIMCACSRELMLHNGELVGKIVKVPESSDYKKLLCGNAVNCSSVLIKADVMKAYPMTDDDIHEDYITWLRILRDSNDRVVFLTFPYLLYRLSINGKSSNKFKSAISTFKVYRRLGLSFFSSIYYFCRYVISAVIKYSF